MVLASRYTSRPIPDVSLVQYSPTRGWRIQCTRTGPEDSDVRVRARIGPTLSGALIGGGRVRPDDTWQIRADGPPPDASNRISLESTDGAVLLGVPVQHVP